jgi:hypothetical protein
MAFTNLEDLFNYREMILPHINQYFDEEKFFIKSDLENYNKYSLENLSLKIYGSRDNYWIILFFNPNLTIEDFKWKNQINNNEFLEKKLNYIYLKKLKKQSYSNSQINNIFDNFNAYKYTELLLPNIKYLSAIKKEIIDYFKKLYKGSN